MEMSGKEKIAVNVGSETERSEGETANFFVFT